VATEALTHRQAALLAAERTCPRCGAFRRGAEFCVECGLRLPELRGTIPSLRRRWVRRIGWYPGDWIWAPLLALVLAAAGTAAAIVVTQQRTRHETTLVATGATPAAATGAPSTRNGHLTWPAGRSGWTIILVSYPSPKGRKTALATAVRAAHAKLTRVGTLASGSYPSLNPGYVIVFSGIFATAAGAEATLGRARQAGFSGAHTAQIAP
jgi:hypothetical protein